jgi:acetyl-CoA acyltransferase
MRMVQYSFTAVDPEVMGLGPVPATKKVLERADMKFDDIDVVELNEAFAVQCVVYMQEFGMKLLDDPRLNPWGGAIAFGHPLASSGCRLMAQLAYYFGEHPEAKYGLTTLCVGLGQGGAVIWENVQN